MNNPILFRLKQMEVAIEKLKERVKLLESLMEPDPRPARRIKKMVETVDKALGK